MTRRATFTQAELVRAIRAAEAAGKVARWTPGELDRLRGLGFSVVDASGLTPLCVGRSQIIGGSRFPLAYLPVVKWEIAA